MQYSEDELIRGIAEGNNILFEFVFRKYYNGLCIFAQAIVKNSHIAEEIVQDTFLKILEQSSKLQIHTSLKAFLYQSVHNNCINFLKSEKTKLKHSEEWKNEILLHAEISLLNFSEELLDKLASNELADYMLKHIHDLPAQCKEVFLLSRDYQLTYPEIASRLGISVNTVKTQILRALDKLRDALKNF